MLEIENHFVLDALLGNSDPFLLLSTIPPNAYLISSASCCSHAGGRAASTRRPSRSSWACCRTPTAPARRLQDLQAQHCRRGQPRQAPGEGQGAEGRAQPLRARHPRPHWIARGPALDDTMEQVARQAIRIRGNFFDNTKMLEECIPQVLLVQGRLPPGRGGPAFSLCRLETRLHRGQIRARELKGYHDDQRF